MTDRIVFLLLLLPLAWSILAEGLRRLTRVDVPDDTSEKYQLLIMVTPILLGLVWLTASRWIPVHVSVAALAGGGQSHLAAAPATAKVFHAKPLPSLPWAPIVLGLWATVAAFQLGRLVIALLRLGHIAGRAAIREVAGARVRVTVAAIPPLAWGRATIVLPETLTAQLSAPGLGLILRHEQAHLDRRDPFYFMGLAALDAALWFNPVLRAQTRRCRLAAELACDAMAIGKNPVERETYAQVLIQTLKQTTTAMPAFAPAAISNAKSGDYKMRLQEIMLKDGDARKPKRLWLYAALAVALAPVTVLQFAWAQGSEPAHAPTPVAAPANTSPAPNLIAPTLVAPVAGAISNGFGPRPDAKNGEMKFHQGVDYRVPVGTAVMAVADGQVSAVYNWRDSYGKVVEIDHGNGLLTRYAHLDDQQVAVGDKVKAGQVIATSGDTGISSRVGAHLHLEVWKNGKVVDPAPLLAKSAG